MATSRLFSTSSTIVDDLNALVEEEPTTSSDQSAIHCELNYVEEIGNAGISLDSSPLSKGREDRYRFFPGYGVNINDITTTTTRIMPARPGRLSWIGHLITRVYRFVRRKKCHETSTPNKPTPYELSDRGIKPTKGSQQNNSVTSSTSPAGTLFCVCGGGVALGATSLLGDTLDPGTTTPDFPIVKAQIHPEPGRDSPGGTNISGGGGDTEGPSTSARFFSKQEVTEVLPRKNLAKELTQEQDIMDDKRRFYKWYQLVRSLNAGTFSRVYLAYHKFSGEFVAVKKIDKKAIQEEISRSLLEIEALKVLDHPNICKLYQTFDAGKYLLIVLEVCRGDLFDVINKHTRIKEHWARKIFAQLASAVDYMHCKGWVHRDLKPENVLFDPNGNVKLIDFNLSARIAHKGLLGWNKLSTHCGTLEYAAPELVRPDKLYEGPPVDSWSLGVLLYTMLAGKFPFEEPNRKEKILRGVYQSPPNLSFDGRHLLIRLLDVTPKNRLTPAQILVHPWITTRDKKHPNYDPPKRYSPPQNAASAERELIDYLAPELGQTPAQLRQRLIHKAYNSFEVGTFHIFERKKEILGRTEFECWKTFWLRNVGNMEELCKKSGWYSKPPF